MNRNVCMLCLQHLTIVTQQWPQSTAASTIYIYSRNSHPIVFWNCVCLCVCVCVCGVNVIQNTQARTQQHEQIARENSPNHSADNDRFVGQAKYHEHGWQQSPWPYRWDNRAQCIWVASDSDPPVCAENRWPSTHLQCAWPFPLERFRCRVAVPGRFAANEVNLQWEMNQNNGMNEMAFYILKFDAMQYAPSHTQKMLTYRNNANKVCSEIVRDIPSCVWWTSPLCVVPWTENWRWHLEQHSTAKWRQH